MTIGPDPMTSILWISCLLGILLLLSSCVHDVDETVEHVIGMFRSRRRFRIVLHRESRVAHMPHPFPRAIVDGLVRHFQTSSFQRMSIYSLARVLGSDFDPSSS